MAIQKIRTICTAILAGLVLSLIALSQTGNIPIPLPPDPASPFVTPSALSVQLDPDYWNGYKQGENQAQIVLPSPANLYWGDNQSTAPGFAIGYHTLIMRAFKPAVTSGYVNYVNVGYNEALNDGGYYLWSHDSNSCHIKVCP